MPRGKQPIRVAPSAQYGDGVAQADAQRAIPLPNTVAQPTAAPVAAPAPPVALPPLTPLNAPTERPMEPVQHGLPSGPGAGPEALGLPNQSATLADTLNSLANQSPAVAQLAAYVNSGRL